MKNFLKRLRQPKVLRIIIAAAIFIVVLAGTFFYFKTKDKIAIENSLVTAPITPISSLTPGTLREVRVTDGQKVKKGDILAITSGEIVRAYTDGTIVDTRQVGDIIYIVSAQDRYYWWEYDWHSCRGALHHYGIKCSSRSHQRHDRNQRRQTSSHQCDIRHTGPQSGDGKETWLSRKPHCPGCGTDYKAWVCQIKHLAHGIVHILIWYGHRRDQTL